MYKRIILALSFLLVVTAALPQAKSVWLEHGDFAYKKKDYPTAIYYYTKILDDTTILVTPVRPYEAEIVNLKPKTSLRDSTSSKPTMYEYVIHQLAHAYQHNYDYKHSADYFEKSAKSKKFVHDKYYHGISLLNIRKYDDAVAEFESYIASKDKNDSLAKEAQRHMAFCYYAQDTIHNSHPLIKVSKMDTIVINKGTSSFAPMYWGGPGKLIFTSARKGGVLTDPEKQDSKYLCDLYYTQKNDSGWSKAVNFGRPVNTGLHEGAGVISVDDIMYFTRWSDKNRDESFIYMAKIQDGLFYECMKLNSNVNLPGYKAQQPFVSFDGTKLFFSSNRPGGKGGFDIWMCDVDENGYTGPAKNLGEPINTPGDEVTPFFHTVSSTLYFSSNEHAGLGGLDIFKSHLNIDDSTWEVPKNVGSPINSPQDDAYFILDRMLMHGYFSSDREPCDGGACYDIYEFDNEPISFDISGYVFDTETNEVIPNALVTIKDVHGNIDPFFVITDEKGYYFTPLQEDMEYFFKAQKNKYFGDAASIATKGKTETTHFQQDFFLSKIPEGEIVIEGIEYDFNKATLRPKSIEIMSKIYDLLMLNDNLAIEINSHTDCRGSDKYNEKLSQQRAQSCVDYLLGRGIKKERLIAKGYGEYKPLIPEAEINKMGSEEEKEAAHQKNRRTAFQVVNEGSINIQIKQNN